MDVIKFAMQMELDGQKFYEKAAAEAPTQGLKELLHYLAEEEKRHFKFFHSLSEGQTPEARKNLASDSLTKTKNIFVAMIEANDQTAFGDEERSAWLHARKIEEEAVAMYSTEADKEEDPARKKLLTQIADEERQHIYLIENVLNFMADPDGFAASQKYSAFRNLEGF